MLKKQDLKPNNLIFHFKTIEKEQIKPKASKGRWLTKNRVTINDAGNRKIIEKNQYNQKLVL